eukprot:jgi/Botrbrau1/21099/Bobra.0558s0001.1
MPLSSPVTIRVANDFGVTRLPTELAYYDLVLGKPWLTVFSPVVNWKLNVVSLIHSDKTHVLVGCQRSDVAFPLTELLKKDVHWTWEGPQIQAFTAMKDLVSSPQCLLMPDLDKPFVVHVDASGLDVGAVLQQDQGQGLQSVAFESRKLQPPERKLAPYDRELLALVHALLKWKHLLLGAKFTVHPDQQALKYLLTAPVRTSRQERWLTEIMRFMPDIKYVKGTDNVVADALSRRVDLAIMHVSCVSVSSLLQEIALVCATDPTVVKLVEEGVLVLRDSVPYSVQSGKVYVHEALREKVLRECHATPFSGHLGINKMYHPYGWVELTRCMS